MHNSLHLDTSNLQVFVCEGLWVKAVVFCSFGGGYGEVSEDCVAFIFAV